MSKQPRADQTPDCPPHWWDLDAMSCGSCRKCGATTDRHRTLAEEMADAQHGRFRRGRKVKKKVSSAKEREA